MNNLKKFTALKILLAILPALIFSQNYAWMTGNKLVGLGFLILWFVMIWNVAEFEEKNKIIERLLRLTEVAFFLLPISAIILTFVLGNEAVTTAGSELEQAGAAIGTMIGGTFVVGIAFVIGLFFGIIMHLITNKYAKKVKDEKYKNIFSKHGVIFTVLIVIVLAIIFGSTSDDSNDLGNQNPLTSKSTKEIEVLSSKVELEITNKHFAEGDFQDQIGMSLNFINKTEKDIRGVQGIVTFYDMFDNKIKSNRITYDEGISANSAKVWEAGLPYNQFMEEDIKLKDIKLENLKIVWEVTDIVYSENTDIITNKNEPNNITQEKVSLEVLEKGLKSANYQDFITLKLKFTNNTEKNIKGVQGTIAFFDIFDNQIYAANIPYDEGIPANSSKEWDASVDYNQFMDEHIKLNNTPLDSMSYDWNIDTIVYEDGTKENL